MTAYEPANPELKPSRLCRIILAYGVIVCYAELLFAFVLSSPCCPFVLHNIRYAVCRYARLFGVIKP